MAARRSTLAAPRFPLSILLLGSFFAPLASAYRPGDIVPTLRSGQYHGVNPIRLYLYSKTEILKLFWLVPT
jgi:hypothetical protein